MFGHDRSRIVDDDVDDYTCGICLNVLNNPMSVYCCRKMNCHHCITMWLKTHKYCPNCRDYLTTDGVIIVPRIIVNRINQMKMKCDRYADGCPAVVAIVDMPKHVKECQFTNCSICKSQELGGKHQCLPYLLKTVNMLKIENSRLRLSNECLLDSISDMTRQEATIDYTIDNFRRMKRKSLSPMVYMNCLPWRLWVQPWINTESNGQTSKTLGIFVECCSKSSDLSCKVVLQFSVLSQKEGIPDLNKNAKHTFAIEHNDWGYKDFAKWGFICNPFNGYITDGKVMIAVTITVDDEEPEEESEEEEEEEEETTASKAVQTEPEFMDVEPEVDEIAVDEEPDAFPLLSRCPRYIPPHLRNVQTPDLDPLPDVVHQSSQAYQDIHEDRPFQPSIAFIDTQPEYYNEIDGTWGTVTPWCSQQNGD